MLSSKYTHSMQGTDSFYTGYFLPVIGHTFHKQNKISRPTIISKAFPERPPTWNLPIKCLNNFINLKIRNATSRKLNIVIVYLSIFISNLFTSKKICMQPNNQWKAKECTIRQFSLQSNRPVVLLLSPANLFVFNCCITENTLVDHIPLLCLWWVFVCKGETLYVYILKFQHSILWQKSSGSKSVSTFLSV